MDCFSNFREYCLLVPTCPVQFRARICKRLWSPGTDPEESILPAYAAWQAGITKRFVEPACQAGNPFLGSLKDLQVYGLT
jgi:hypothetical protein